MDTAPKTRWSKEERWIALVKSFERIVIVVLMVLLMVIVAITTVELGWILFRDLFSTRLLVLDTEEMLDLFGFFMLVLIGLELNTSLKSYIRAGVIRGDVVIEVSLIAVAQKLIILDMSKYGGIGLIGVGTLVLALALAFWLVRTAYSRSGVQAAEGDDARDRG
jgi:uncharacterized membrane protein (DUF373 family)